MCKDVRKLSVCRALTAIKLNLLQALLIAEGSDPPVRHIRNSTVGILYDNTPQNLYGFLQWAQLSARSILGLELKESTVVQQHKQEIQNLHDIQKPFRALAKNPDRPVRQICCFERSPRQYEAKSSRTMKKLLRSKSSAQSLIPEWVILPESRVVGLSHLDATGYKRVVAELKIWLRDLGKAEKRYRSVIPRVDEVGNKAIASTSADLDVTPALSSLTAKPQASFRPSINVRSYSI